MPAGSGWEALLRDQIKLEHGRGWSISPQSGKVKLTRRHKDGTRTSVMLDIPWAPTSGTAVLQAVSGLVHRMEDQSMGLRRAHDLTETKPNVAGGLDWEAAARAFLDSRRDRKERTLADTRTRVKRALATLGGKPAPRDGASLMIAYEKQYLRDLPPGSAGRRRNLQDVAAFLRFAVQRCGAESRWMPVSGEERQELIGAADGRDAHLTPPIKPEQLADLLDALEADGRHDLRLAVGLVGLYGLRPAELATLRMEGDQLRVGQVKRSAHDLRKSARAQALAKDRLVLPLDIPGREGLGAQFAAQWASGLVKLPPQILTAIQSGDLKLVGDGLRQYLNRYRPWKSLVAANPGMTAYSLRHGYAWRAHKAFSRSLSIRDTAALMGHSVEIHSRYYGSWVDEESLLDAVAQLSVNREATTSQI